MKKIIKFFRFFDINGETIQLNIKGKARSTTAIGGILTILTTVMILVATWLIGDDIIYKTKPMTDLEDQLYKERPFIHLDKNTFPISFCIQDMNQKLINSPRYMKFEIINTKIYNFNATLETFNYEFENCTYDHFPGLSKEDVNTAGILNYQCLKKQNITIGGFYDNSLIQFAVFRLRICNNNTDGGICAPIEEIHEFINSQVVSWNVYFQNTIINPKDYNKPSTTYVVNQYKIVKLSAFKNFNIFIRTQEIETDKGIIFEDLSSEFSYAYDGTDLDESDALDFSMIDINLIVANHGPIYHRRYLKVPTVIANIGGLTNTLFLGIYVLTFYFSKVKLNTSIMNNIFEFNYGCSNNINNERGGRETIKPISGLMISTYKASKYILT
jgi:hypothetical protein